MSYRRIIAVLAGDRNDRGVLDAATAVARLADAHIVGLSIRRDPAELLAYIGDGISVGAAEPLLAGAAQETEKRAAAARQTFAAWQHETGFPSAEKAPGPGSVSVAWREDSGIESDVISRHGRLADLIVIARPSADLRESSRTRIEAALFETGRPVLVAPAAMRTRPPGRVLVAWNGSIEVTRAIGLALPFLVHAGHVDVATVAERGHEARTVQDLIGYLAWHGVKARHEAIDSEGAAGADLLAAVDRLNSDLLVMGAYTHSRMRQMIFGGVTQHVLVNAAVPVLMAR